MPIDGVPYVQISAFTGDAGPYTRVRENIEILRIAQFPTYLLLTFDQELTYGGSQRHHYTQKKLNRPSLCITTTLERVARRTKKNFYEDKHYTSFIILIHIPKHTTL